MERREGRVPTSSQGLRRAEHGGGDSTEKGSDAWQDEQDPGAKGRREILARRPLSACPQPVRPGEIFQDDVLHELERHEEDRTEKPGGEPDQRGMQKNAAENPEFELRDRGLSETKKARRATRSRFIGFARHPCRGVLLAWDES